MFLLSAAITQSSFHRPMLGHRHPADFVTSEVFTRILPQRQFRRYVFYVTSVWYFFYFGVKSNQLKELRKKKIEIL